MLVAADFLLVLLCYGPGIIANLLAGRDRMPAGDE